MHWRRQVPTELPTSAGQVLLSGTASRAVPNGTRWVAGLVHAVAGGPGRPPPARLRTAAGAGPWVSVRAKRTLGLLRAVVNTGTWRCARMQRCTGEVHRGGRGVSYRVYSAGSPFRRGVSPPLELLTPQLPHARPRVQAHALRIDAPPSAASVHDARGKPLFQTLATVGSAAGAFAALPTHPEFRREKVLPPFFEDAVFPQNPPPPAPMDPDGTVGHVTDPRSPPTSRCCGDSRPPIPPPPWAESCFRVGGGEGDLEHRSPKVCVPQKAQIHISFCTISFFPDTEALCQTHPRPLC